MLVVMPTLFAPTAFVAVLQIVLATGLLYAGAYFGSRIMRLLTTRGERLHI
ncbi:MAG: hypothetical protein P1Q69_19170 [Candidatus Thorarchaeota archaeon]|nr:hypothetical protein [Candidatus Thorarchaeota archaeon]